MVSKVNDSACVIWVSGDKFLSYTLHIATSFGHLLDSSEDEASCRGLKLPWTAADITHDKGLGIVFGEKHICKLQYRPRI